MADQFPLVHLAVQLLALGASEILVKHLSPNDNTKNQIYLAGDISSLGLLPIGEVLFNPGTSKKPGAGTRGPIFRADVNFWWMLPEVLVPAPNAKLILYPQYPEVRLSGFISGCSNAPSELFDINQARQGAGTGSPAGALARWQGCCSRVCRGFPGSRRAESGVR